MTAKKKSIFEAWQSAFAITVDRDYRGGSNDHKSIYFNKHQCCHWPYETFILSQLPQQSAELALQDSERILDELQHTLERLREKHRENIGERKRNLLSRAEKEERILIGQISILKRKDAEVDSLVPPVQNNGQFLQVASTGSDQ